MKYKSKEIPSCKECGKTTHFFCHLNDSEKEQLSLHKGGNFFKKGQTIFYEGNHTFGLFCVYEGAVKLSKLGKDGKEQIVRFAKTGDLIGYRSLLNQESYQATAIAIEDTYVCLIPKGNFLSVVENNPALSLKLIKLLSNDLKNAEQHLVDVAQKTVKERIAESLLVLKATFGYLEDKTTLNIHVTRAEIADMAGTTTESAIRTLGQFNDEGIISLTGKKIQLLNEAALIRQSNSFD